MLTKNDLDNDLAIVLAIYENLAGAYALHARNMINQQGTITALTNLIVKPNLQQGFETLRDNYLLQENSFEKLVLKYAPLFSAQAVATAKYRLENPYL